MVGKFKSKRQAGFTIIEVLIVLAIAGLIMLIVFLAVPALQRNARNTTKRADASKVMGAVGEFSANNNGKIPVAADVATITPLANLSSGTIINAVVPSTVATVVAPTGSEIEIGTGMTCSAGVATTAAAPTAANYQTMVAAGSARSVVALFSVDAPGGQQTTQCLGS